MNNDFAKAVVTSIYVESISFSKQTLINSRVPIVLLKDGLVLQVAETSDNGKENRWNLYVSCKILSAFHSNRYFLNLIMLSVIYSLKTRGRSVFLREIYNLCTFITCKWIETFTINQIEPCKNDGDLQIRVQYCFLCQNR